MLHESFLCDGEGALDVSVRVLGCSAILRESSASSCGRYDVTIHGEGSTEELIGRTLPLN